MYSSVRCLSNFFSFVGPFSVVIGGLCLYVHLILLSCLVICLSFCVYVTLSVYSYVRGLLLCKDVGGLVNGLWRLLSKWVLRSLLQTFFINVGTHLGGFFFIYYFSRIQHVKAFFDDSSLRSTCKFSEAPKSKLVWISDS